jgi:2-polyprenyl-3-methyl-5-hydroxy-6-metoxy-1,4-benzoquinol methylase
MTASEVIFDKYAVKGAYHWVELFGPLHRRNAYTMARYQAVLNGLVGHKLVHGAKVLDVGCGDAALSGLIVRRLACELVGIDTTALSLELAAQEFKRRGLAGRFVSIDGYNYPFDTGAFDAVVCSDVIEHVQDPRRMLAEMWRVLVPGGILVLTTPVRYTEQPLDIMHVQEWFPSHLQALSEEVLCTSVELRLSHPVAWAELYASSAPVSGRLVRFIVNLAAVLGYNVFSSMGRLRAPSTQTVIAVKPLVSNA